MYDLIISNQNNNLVSWWFVQTGVPIKFSKQSRIPVKSTHQHSSIYIADADVLDCCVQAGDPNSNLLPSRLLPLVLDYSKFGIFSNPEIAYLDCMTNLWIVRRHQTSLPNQLQSLDWKRGRERRMRAGIPHSSRLLTAIQTYWSMLSKPAHTVISCHSVTLH